ncbi:MAG: hypothetical protein ACRD59_15265 [Candidatus Acidiferrales bacterium]
MDDLPAQQNSGDTSNPVGEPTTSRDVVIRPSDKEERTFQTRKYYCYRKLQKAPIWIEAVCAVALVVITGFYTRYAGRQLQVMRRQLTDFEARESAILQVRANWDASKSEATFNIENIGNSPAMDINYQLGGGGGPVLDQSKNPAWLPPTQQEIRSNIRLVDPSPTGFPLSAGKTQPLTQGIAIDGDVRTGRRYLRYFLNVGYRDIFGNTKQLFVCMYYDSRPTHQTFDPCHVQETEQKNLR